MTINQTTPAHPDRVAALRAEWESLAHAMQAGVAFEQARGSEDGTPKHLRVGINAALSDHGALVALLIRKGVITELEYLDAIVEQMRDEVRAYERRASAKMNASITFR